MNAAVAPRFCSIQRVLFAVDFSEASAHVASHVRSLTGLYRARLWLAHVVEPTLSPDAALVHSDGALAQAGQHMRRFAASPAMRGMSYETVLRAGELWPVLSSVVEEHGIDVIAAGVHGRGWLGKLVLGSSAELLVRHATCPVLTVGPRVPAASDGRLLRILFPSDTRNSPAHSLPYAVRLANEHNAQIVFLHVLHREAMPVDYPDEESIDDERYARAMYWISDHLIAPGGDFRRQPELMVESGVAADCIVDIAGKVGADLIVMPVRRSGEPGKSHAPWSTAYRVLAHAPCPVLTLTE